jgi:hypothetical protein
MISLNASHSFRLSFLITLLSLYVALVCGGLVWRGAWNVQAFGLAFASLGSLGFLLWRGVIQRARIVRTPLDGIILAVVVVLLISWFLSPNLRQGMARVGSYIGYIWLFYILLDVFEAGLNRKAVLVALLVMTASVGLMAVLETYAAYLSWWEAVGAFGAAPPFPHRLASLVGHSNSYMGLMNLCAPLAFVAFFTVRSRLSRLGAGLWMAFYLLSVPFSSSRGGWLGIASWIVVLTLLTAYQTSARQRLVRLPSSRPARLALFAAPVLLAAPAFAAYRFWLFFAAHPSHGNDPFGGRSHMWSIALQVWQSSSLVFGTGPGHFPYGYLSVYPHVPPHFWAIHAHSLPVEMLAEFGLAGLLALLALTIAGAVWLLRRLQLSSPAARPLNRAILAGIAAWLAQSIVDEQTAVFAVMVPLVVLLAAAVHSSPQMLPRRRLPLTWLGLPVLILTGASIYSLWAYAPVQQGIHAARRGDLSAAAALIQLGADRDPALPYMHTQAGLAWAALWGETGEPTHLANARRAFEHSLVLEPSLSLWWANLSVLDWHAGDAAHARQHIAIARQRSVSEPSYPLIAAWFAEAMGDSPAALESYHDVLDLAPTWSPHPFWESTALRRKALASWFSTAASAHPSYPHTLAAYQYAQSGDQIGLNRQLAFADWTGEPYLAQLTARVALPAPQDDLSADLSTYHAIRASVAQPLLRTGSNFANIYAFWLYFRQGFPYDIVPGYLQLDTDYGQSAALFQFHHLLQSQGGCQEAAHTWDVLQREVRGGSLEPIPPAPTCTPSGDQP